MSWPRMHLIAIGSALAMALSLLAGCGSDDEPDATQAEVVASTLPQGSEPVDLDPADFTTEITNTYWPMEPGSRWVYRETDGDAVMRVVVTVTDRTKLIANG